MKAQNIIFIPLILSLLFLTVQAMEATELREDVRQVRYFDPPRVTDEELQLFSPAFLAEIAFKADPDIPLDVELQRLVHDLCKDAHPELTPALVFAVIHTESRFDSAAVNYNAQSIDKGLCQINSVNWGWLADEGIDIHTDSGNIQACVIILGKLLDNGYTLREALAAYNCGESNVQAGFGYADEILKGAK